LLTAKQPRLAAASFGIWRTRANDAQLKTRDGQNA